MKKVLSFVLVLSVVLSLAACSGQNNGKESTDKFGVDASPTETIWATQSTTQHTTENAPLNQPATEPSTEATAPATTEKKEDNNSLDPNFKAAMDSYENFFDEYVAIMKKYTTNPTDLSILADYAKYMGQYADMMQKLEQWEDEELNPAELAYYVDVQARITKKLLEVA